MAKHKHIEEAVGDRWYAGDEAYIFRSWWLLHTIKAMTSDGRVLQTYCGIDSPPHPRSKVKRELAIRVDRCRECDQVMELDELVREGVGR